MYSDAVKKRSRWIVPIVVLVLIAAALIVRFARGSARDVSEEGAEAIRAAVERSALQCYVVEGVYPPSLAYLEENYGLEVNTADYYVTYDAFASNLPPTVKVLAKNG